MVPGAGDLVVANQGFGAERTGNQVCRIVAQRQIAAAVQRKGRAIAVQVNLRSVGVRLQSDASRIGESAAARTGRSEVNSRFVADQYGSRILGGSARRVIECQVCRVGEIDGPSVGERRRSGCGRPQHQPLVIHVDGGLRPHGNSVEIDILGEYVHHIETARIDRHQKGVRAVVRHAGRRPLCGIGPVSGSASPKRRDLAAGERRHSEAEE